MGVIIGTLALFIILSGFSGLRSFSDNLLNISDPDIKITPTQGKTFPFTAQLTQLLSEQTAILSFTKVVEERVFLKYNEKQHIAYIKGIDEQYANVTQIEKALIAGDWLSQEYRNTAIIGNGISYKLSIGISTFGTPLEIYVPKPGKGMVNPNTAFTSEKVQISGVYSGTEEFENKYVFVPISLAQDLLKYNANTITAIEVNLADSNNSTSIATALQKALGPNFKVQTKAQLNALFYKVINTENFVSYLIFTLIVIIALFNVVGALLMMIIDKKHNIKTLFNLGASVKDIQRIFVYQGVLLTLSGTLIGLSLGTLLVLLQQQFSLFMITPSIAYPVEFRLANFGIVASTIMLLGFVAAKIASRSISKRFIEH